MAMEELTRAWIRLTAALYFLRRWPLPAKATGKETVDIQEVLAELGRQEVLTFTDGLVTGFSREKAWRLLDEQAAV